MPQRSAVSPKGGEERGERNDQCLPIAHECVRGRQHFNQQTRSYRLLKRALLAVIWR
jgi:hypothetical protein